jgi:CMP-N,N'-diacetyllegionaminic acid synthase
MLTVAIIPARGGSKGIPQKNLRSLAGRPLIAHSIEDALEAKLVDRVYVSTDDPDIAEVSMKYGAEVILRPEHLANDTASSESALTHALHKIERSGISPDLIVFLQCTSPIRTGHDIDKAIHILQSTETDSGLSVSPSHRFLWKSANGSAKAINYDYQNRPRRQDMEPQYAENGSIYIFKPWVLKNFNNRLGGKISLFPMDELSGHEIDTPADFELVEFFLPRVD